MRSFAVRFLLVTGVVALFGLVDACVNTVASLV